jgi:hypothetical protein
MRPVFLILADRIILSSTIQNQTTTQAYPYLLLARAQDRHHRRVASRGYHPCNRFAVSDTCARTVSQSPEFICLLRAVVAISRLHPRAHLGNSLNAPGPPRIRSKPLYQPRQWASGVHPPPRRSQRRKATVCRSNSQYITAEINKQITILVKKMPIVCHESASPFENMRPSTLFTG